MSLSDKTKYNLLLVKDVKEKIKDCQKELGDEMFLLPSQINKINKIFLKHFGEKLI